MSNASLRRPQQAMVPNASWRRWAAGVAMAIAAMTILAYAAAVGYMWVGQEKMLFAPDVLPANHHFRVGNDVHEVAIDVQGAKLSALHMRLPNPRGVVFYLNALHLHLDDPPR